MHNFYCLNELFCRSFLAWMNCNREFESHHSESPMGDQFLEHMLLFCFCKIITFFLVSHLSIKFKEDMNSLFKNGIEGSLSYYTSK